MAEKLDVNISKLREHVSSKANMIVASSETLFMSTMNEDNIVNWIHDMTDYGWGIDCLQISLKIKSFLSHEAYSVMFDDDLPINQPSEKWIEGKQLLDFEQFFTYNLLIILKLKQHSCSHF